MEILNFATSVSLGMFDCIVEPEERFDEDTINENVNMFINENSFGMKKCEAALKVKDIFDKSLSCFKEHSSIIYQYALEIHNMGLSIDNINEYDVFQLKEIKLGLADNLNINYLDSNFDYTQMYVMRRFLLKGIDLSKYINHQFSQQAMIIIGEIILHNIDVTPLLDPRLTYQELNDIKKTIKERNNLN